MTGNKNIEPVFFPTQTALRKWFEKNHKKKSELLLGFYKAGSGKPSVTWSQSVDEALCFGWIDGVRRSLNDQSYTIRFTPRKSGSNWSAINIGKVKELSKLGLMKPEGTAAFVKREEHKSRIYSHEKAPEVLYKAFEKKFRDNTWFTGMPPSYRKVCIHWIMSAKQEPTREKRLGILIHDSEAGERMSPLRYGKK